MPRPRFETQKEHTPIIHAKRKDGWAYVQRVVSVYVAGYGLGTTFSVPRNRF